jgi:hypothetical protein
MIAALLLLAAQDATISNEFLAVRYAGGAVTVTAAGAAAPFAREGRFATTGGTARRVDAGTIEVAYPNGNRDRIRVEPGVPFVLFTSTVHNSGKDVMVIERPRPLSFAVDAAGRKVLGTGGLADPAKAPGSYMWLAVADPATRAGTVCGWLTTARGSGVVLPEAAGANLRIHAQIDYGKLRLAPGADETLETFALGWFRDARLGLEAWADAVAKVHAIKLPPQPTVYCTWYHARASDEKRLAAQSDFAAAHLKPYGFSVVQIDDGWQDGVKDNGPKKNFTRIDANGPYPSGMKATADRIKAAGLVPGIWFMPFAGTWNDPWFADKQNLFARRADGKPYEVKWGGTSLDMTNPAAREYLRGIVHRIVHEWGYEYLKMDGLWTGSATEMAYVNDAYKDDQIGNAVLHDPGQTNIQAFRSGLKLIRDTAGPKTFILGCTVAQNMRSYGASFGLVDAMRIGPDNGANWKSILRGPTSGARNYFLHGRVWYNDPDPLYVRAALPLDQARAISAWVTLSGQLNASSDAFADLPPERLDLLRRTMPAHGLQARPEDLFEQPIPRVWTVVKGDRTVVGLFNWSDQQAVIEPALDPGKEYIAYEYWTGTLRTSLKTTLPPTSSAILSVRPRAAHPQVIGTSRHITQGLIDLKEEKWAAPELSGASEVVGGDAYEIRIAAAGWKATGGSHSVKQEGDLVRLRIEPPSSQTVKWSVRFRRAS